MNYHLGELGRNHAEFCNIVVCDGAGWHISQGLALPDNVKLLKLPPYSPELNPTERVWLYSRDHYTGNLFIDDLDDLEELLVSLHHSLKTQPELLRSITKTRYAEIQL